MEKTGYFRFALVTNGNSPVVFSPSDESLKSEALEVVSKIDSSLPISVVEKEKYIFTSQPYQYATFTVVTDKSVDADSCGDFLREMRKKWSALYGREMPDAAVFQNGEYQDFIEKLIENSNSDRKEFVEKAENSDDEEAPEIILKDGEHGIKVTEIEDPKTEREAPLLNDSQNEITLKNGEHSDLPLTFPQEHFDESMATLRVKICWQRYRCVIIIGAALFALLVIAFLILCDGFSFKCFKKQSK